MAATKEKRKTTTSPKVKNRYNSKAYDRLNLMVYKGQKAFLKEFASQHSLSLNELVTKALTCYLSEKYNINLSDYRQSITDSAETFEPTEDEEN